MHESFYFISNPASVPIQRETNGSLIVTLMITRMPTRSTIRIGVIMSVIPSIIRVTAVTLMSGMGVLRMIVPLPVLFLLHTFHSRIRTSKEWNYKGGTGRKLQSPARMLAYDWNLHECWRLDE